VYPGTVSGRNIGNSAHTIRRCAARSLVEPEKQLSAASHGQLVAVRVGLSGFRQKVLGARGPLNPQPDGYCDRPGYVQWRTRGDSQRPGPVQGDASPMDARNPGGP